VIATARPPRASWTGSQSVSGPEPYEVTGIVSAPGFNNVLTGTPTRAGTFSFPMQVQDSQDNTATGAVTITINP
jgi:hypothetical protein